MTARRPATAQARAIPLKALYTVAELITLTGVKRWRLRSLLDQMGVKLLVTGRTVYVPLSEIERCMQPLWREITLAHGVVQGDDESAPRAMR